MGRVAILGDVGGYSRQLELALESLGIDSHFMVIPEDLVVIQVGDLVHKGPDPAGCIAIVDRALAQSPGRWIQLVGNHESQYLGGREFWQPGITDALAADLRRWLADGEARMAVAIDSSELGPVLVTHAGLTRGKWAELGRPSAPALAAALLNAKLAEDPEAAFAAGRMLGLDTEPGVVWAEAAGELLTGWAVDLGLPFSQVHGHTSGFSWRRGCWVADVPTDLLARAEVDVAAHHTMVRWPDATSITGVDPGYSTRGAASPLVPLILDAKVYDAPERH